jgi:O-antigen ligase
MAISSPTLAYQIRWTDLFKAPLNDPNLTGRIAFWKAGINEFIAQPFGIGFTGSKIEITGNIWYVHNLWLYILLGSGFIGCIGFVWIIFTLSKYFLTNLARSNLESSMFCTIGIGIIICLLVNGVSSPIFSDPYMITFIYGPLAIALAVIKSERLRLIKKP